MFFRQKQWVTLLALLFAFACGEKKKTEEGDKASPEAKEDVLMSPVELAVRDASASEGIPERFLLAVGYAETRLQPEKLGFGLAEVVSFPQASSAFAISRKELGIDLDSTQDRLSTQVRAYAAWLATQLEGKDLSEEPLTSQEKFDWLWEIATLHREAVEHKYTERSVFTKELVALLNRGFSWFDPESRQTRSFPPENPPIAENELNDQSLGLMSVDMRQSQVDFAKRIFLSTTPLEREEATPRGIEVIHCPFTLSACLDMQNNLELLEGAKGLTHYVIPTNSLVSDMSLQVRNHYLILDEGTREEDHKVRVMLVGSSGRLVNGSRKVANGNWFTHWQLDKLAELTHDLCYQMTFKDSDPQFETIEECLTPGKSVSFRKVGQGTGSWFGIPDFDEQIFFSAVGKANQEVQGESLLKGKKEIYTPGSEILLEHHFSKSVRYIEREQLIRCENTAQAELQWVTVDLLGVGALGLSSAQPTLSRKESQTLKLWSRGPNGDGSHFIRMKFYDEEGELLSWDAKSLRLETFDERDNPILIHHCQNP